MICGVIKEIARATEYVSWRRHLHSIPELAFKEIETARFLADRLDALGIPFVTQVGRTGVVASITSGSQSRAVGLRADMNALPLVESNEFGHRSKHTGVMHACGHDGHMAMLLAAASYLRSNQCFDGTVHCIFQPAEEESGGANAMIDDHLFERFPMDAVFGLHVFPHIPIGSIAVGTGAVMACCDEFDIALTGRGGHAAMPHQAEDPVVAAAHLITALQSISSRNANPLDALVLTVTSVSAGDAYNVIPERAQLRGTIRALSEEARTLAEARLHLIAEQLARAFGVVAEIRYRRLYPLTMNAARESNLAANAAADVVGEDHVDRSPRPSMGAEDFSFLLQARPGAYAWLGNGAPDHTAPLHSPRFEFNDDALAIGASYWIRLVERLMPRNAEGPPWPSRGRQ